RNPPARDCEDARASRAKGLCCDTFSLHSGLPPVCRAPGRSRVAGAFLWVRFFSALTSLDDSERAPERLHEPAAPRIEVGPRRGLSWLHLRDLDVADHVQKTDAGVVGLRLG